MMPKQMFYSSTLLQAAVQAQGSTASGLIDLQTAEQCCFWFMTELVRCK
jgi:hypothetical protein